MKVPRRVWLTGLALAAGMLLSLWVAQRCWAQKAPPARIPPSALSTPSTPLLPQAARSVGLRRCLPAVSAISQRVIAGTQQHDVLVDWDRKNPDGGAFFSLTALKSGALSSVFSLTTVPETGGGCSVLAEHVSAAPISCKQLAEQELAGYTGVALLPTVMVYVRPDKRQETVILVQSAPGCLVMRRQVQYALPAASSAW